MRVRGARWSPHAVLVSALLGCADDHGPQRYELSGQVSYNGAPVPAGYILFNPDTGNGNQGPGGSANIVDGRYETLSGEGTIGGPHLVTISGTDGTPYDMGGAMNPMGRPLFDELTLPVDLPHRPATWNFELPPK